MTNAAQKYTREDGSVDIHAALENGDALRRQAINITIRGAFRRMINALGATRGQSGNSIGDRLHETAPR